MTWLAGLCTIESMNSSHDAALDEGSEESATADSRAVALNRIREAENERLSEERSVRKRLTWLGVVIGAAVGLSIGYMATLITIVDAGVGDFGFKFYRPNFVDGYLRVITAYLIGGGLVGGTLSYLLFTTRSEAASPIRWVITGVFYAICTPLIIGFLLPLTLLIFGDFIEGLRPGLWLSAFVETLLGSFLDGYIFMVKILYAGWLGAVMYLALCIGTYVFTQRVSLPESLTRVVPASVVICTVAAIVAILPLIIFAFGPFSLTTAFASFLTGENL